MFRNQRNQVNVVGSATTSNVDTGNGRPVTEVNANVTPKPRQRVSYATAVRRQQNANSHGATIQNKYKVDRTTCIHFKFRETPKREQLWEFFEKLEVPLSKIEGIEQRPYGKVDVTFRTRETAVMVDKLVWKKKNEGVSLPIHVMYVPERLSVLVKNIPVRFPESLIVKYFEENHGKVHDFKFPKDRHGIAYQYRTFLMDSADLFKKPVKSYVNIEGHDFYVAYENQVESCKYCGEERHDNDLCPRRSNHANKNGNERLNTKDDTTRGDSETTSISNNSQTPGVPVGLEPTQNETNIDQTVGEKFVEEADRLPTQEIPIQGTNMDILSTLTETQIKMKEDSQTKVTIETDETMSEGTIEAIIDDWNGTQNRSDKEDMVAESYISSEDEQNSDSSFDENSQTASSDSEEERKRKHRTNVIQVDASDTPGSATVNQQRKKTGKARKGKPKKKGKKEDNRSNS